MNADHFDFALERLASLREEAAVARQWRGREGRTPRRSAWCWLRRLLGHPAAPHRAL
ncbi:MAG: hypothetical protein ACR2J4_09590 [Deinococcus sp.]